MGGVFFEEADEFEACGAATDLAAEEVELFAPHEVTSGVFAPFFEGIFGHGGTVDGGVELDAFVPQRGEFGGVVGASVSEQHAVVDAVEVERREGPILRGFDVILEIVGFGKDGAHDGLSEELTGIASAAWAALFAGSAAPFAAAAGCGEQGKVLGDGGGFFSDEAGLLEEGGAFGLLFLGGFNEEAEPGELDADGFGGTGFFHPFDLLFTPAFGFDGGCGAGAVCIDDFERGEVEFGGSGLTCGSGADSS